MKKILLILLYIFATTNVFSQFISSAPTRDGSIGASEYGNHTNNFNQWSDGSRTWYMTWDATNLYIAVQSNGNATDDELVIYIDTDPQAIVNGGADANGCTGGIGTYDGNNYGVLPFRANFNTHITNGYHQHRISNNNNTWPANTDNSGSITKTSSGNVQEIAIAWSLMGGRPAAFNIFFYINGGSPYGGLSNYGANTDGTTNTNLTGRQYFNIASTADGSSTVPFSRLSYVNPNGANTLTNYGTAYYNVTANSSNTITIGADLGITNLLHINTGSTLVATGVRTITFSGASSTLGLQCDGTLNPNNGGGNDINIVASSGTTTISGSAANTAYKIFNLTVNAGATVQAPSSGTVDLGWQFGTITVASTGVLNFVNGSGVVNLTNNGATDSDVTISVASTGTATFNNVTNNGFTGSSITLANVSTNAATALSFNNITNNLNNTIIASSGGTASTAVPMTIRGNLTNDGSFTTLSTSNSRFLDITVTGSASVLTSSVNISYRGLTIANTGSTSSNSLGVTLAGAGTVTIVTTRLLTVNSGARLILDVSTPLTLSTSPIFTVNGFFRRGVSTISGFSSSTFIVNNGGVYEHNFTTTSGVIPTGTWNTGSTCRIIGYTTYAGPMTSANGWAQTFHHFEWACAAQTATTNWQLNATTPPTINGNFIISNTNSAVNGLRLASSGTYTLNIGGLVVNSTNGNARLDLSNGADGIINLTSDFSLSQPANTAAITKAGGTSIVNFVKASGTQTFTQSSGTISNVITWNVGDGVTTNTLQFLSDANLGGSAFIFNVLDKAGVDFQTFILSGSGTFGAATGATLTTANTSASGALNTSGSNGSVQTTTRTFTNTGVNYIFNGVSAQVSGSASGAATSINNLNINNSSGVTLSNATTVANQLNLTAGTFTTGGNLTLSNGCTITRTVATATLSAAPTFGTSVNIIYNNTIALTTGVEIPTSATVLNSLTIASNGNFNVTLGASIQVNGVLTLSGTTTSTLALSTNTLTFAGSSSIVRTGSNSINASNASAVLLFTNTSPIVIPTTALLGSIGKLELNGSGGVTLGNNQSISILTLTSGTLTVGANTLTYNGTNGALTRTSGTINASNASASLIFSHSGGTLTFPTGLFTSNIINSLTINGSSGVNLGVTNPIQINATLALTGTGVLGVQANTLTFAGGVSCITRTSGSINASNASAVLAFTNSLATTIPDLAIQATLSGLIVNGAGVTLGSPVTGSTFTSTSLNLMSGSLNNSTTNITLANGATITRSGGSLTAAPVFGTTGTHRVNVTITGNCTAGNELAGTTGGIGTLTVNNNATYTLNADRTLDAISVASGATIDGATFVLTPRASGAATIAGTFKTANLVGFSGSATAAISSTNTPTFTLTGSTIEYSAASASQVITARSDYNNLTLSGAFAKAISGSTTIGGNLNFNAAADILVIGSNTLTLNGTETGSGSLRGSATSNLTIGGTGALGTLNFDQSTDGTTNVLNDVVVNRITSGTLSLGNKLVIVNSYTPTAGVLTTGGFLHIRSTSSNTARIAASGGGGGGYISGDVTVERHLTASSNRAYRLLTPGVTTSTNIRANWQEGTNNPDANTNNIGTTDYGTHITGSGGNSNGFDVTQNNAASVYLFDQAAQNWTALTNTNVNILNAKTGYLAFIRGNRNEIATINTTTGSSNTTLRATGTLAQGTQTFTSLASDVPGGDAEVSLVTNPFAAPISWSSFYTGSNATNFKNFITIWDPNVNTRGGFITVTNGGSTSGGATNLTTNIQSGQAFFVTTKSGINSPTLTILESDKSTTNNLNVFRTGPQTEQLNIQLKYINAGITRSADGVLALFSNSYSNGLDGNDAEQIANWDEDVALLRNGKALSIESRDLINDNDSLFIKIANINKTAAVYTWEIAPTNFNAPGLQAFLLDKFINTSTPISLLDTTRINFTVSSNLASQVADRFTIVFKTTGVLPVTITQLKATQKNNTVAVNFTTVNEINIDHYVVEKSSNAVQFTTLQQLTANGSSSYTADDANTIQGANYYRVKIVEQNGRSYYSNIVKILIGKTGANDFVIYPNPVKGNSFSIQLVNKEKGVYVVQLSNANGQTIVTKSIQHVGGSLTVSIPINATLSQGIYQLKLVDENGNQQVQQLIKE